LTTITAAAVQEKPMDHDLDANKRNAIAFYRTAYLGDPVQAVEDYVGAQYIQHNPLVADGKQAFIDYFSRMAREHPDKRITFVRAVAQDDLVALHTHQVWPGDGEYVTMDFFRFDERGRIVEHWDAIQAVPETSLNGNTMF
jgi:predicted SnoaL-like aldol condensation-catalyzing enzyme